MNHVDEDTKVWLGNDCASLTTVSRKTAPKARTLSSMVAEGPQNTVTHRATPVDADTAGGEEEEERISAEWVESAV